MFPAPRLFLTKIHFQIIFSVSGSQPVLCMWIQGDTWCCSSWYRWRLSCNKHRNNWQDTSWKGLQKMWCKCFYMLHSPKRNVVLTDYFRFMVSVSIKYFVWCQCMDSVFLPLLPANDWPHLLKNYFKKSHNKHFFYYRWICMRRLDTVGLRGSVWQKMMDSKDVMKVSIWKNLSIFPVKFLTRVKTSL